MSVELNAFFEEIKTSNQSFLFLRLYHNPSSVLGNKQDMDDAEQEYFELYDFCDLILNNNLSIFLELALKDENFRNKLDLQLYRKLQFFLWDSIEFKKYRKFQDNEDLMKLLRQEMPVFEYLEKKNLLKTNDFDIGLVNIHKIYTKYKRLFDHNYSQEQVEGYDEQQAHSVIFSLNLKMECMLENILRRIEEDDYSGDYDSVYLYLHSIRYSEMEAFKLFDATVCKNEFLDIMEILLQKGEISGIALNHAIEIVDVSIGIKTYTFADATSFRIRLGNDLVNEFDLKRAQSILSELSLLKLNQDKNQLSNSKIIYLYKR